MSDTKLPQHFQDYHCCADWERHMTVCGLDIINDTPTSGVDEFFWDFPQHWIPRPKGWVSGDCLLIKCRKCLEHPDMPLLALRVLDEDN